MRVYLYLLKHGGGGVREIQRALNLSSGALAQYHLNKLESLGVAKSDNGNYAVNKDISVDVLQGFTKVGTHLVPRFIFYAVSFGIFAGFLMYKVFTIAFLPSVYEVALGVLLIAAVAAFWYETVMAWRHLP
jgi:SOS-response transcriptional repressor LexA